MTRGDNRLHSELPSRCFLEHRQAAEAALEGEGSIQNMRFANPIGRKKIFLWYNPFKQEGDCLYCVPAPTEPISDEML